MSRITHIPVELGDLIKESNLIIEAEFVEPFTEEVIVKGIDPNPPFIKKGSVFRVKNILKNSGKVSIPDIIQVPGEDWRRSLAQYKETYGGAPARSFEVKRYESEVPSIRKSNILFLHQFQNSFELTMRDSYESSDNLEKVTMLIAADKW